MKDDLVSVSPVFPSPFPINLMYVTPSSTQTLSFYTHKNKCKALSAALCFKCYLNGFILHKSSVTAFFSTTLFLWYVHVYRYVVLVDCFYLLEGVLSFKYSNIYYLFIYPPFDGHFRFEQYFALTNSTEVYPYWKYVSLYTSLCNVCESFSSYVVSRSRNVELCSVYVDFYVLYSLFGKV